MSGSDLDVDDDAIAGLSTTASQFGRHWRSEAACRGMKTQQFFPVTHGGTLRPKLVCAGCGVRANCLAFALTTNQRSGIWGGLDEVELWKLRRRARQLGHLAGEQDEEPHDDL